LRRLRPDRTRAAGAIVDERILAHLLESFCATARPRMSTAPPGGNGTMMRTGLDG